jgi:hypothetical protein
MEQGIFKNWDLSKVSVPMNGYDFVFTIGTMHNESGVLDLLYLQLSGYSLDFEKKSFCALYFDSDFVLMTAVQEAAIKLEREDPGFLERKGSQALDIVAEKVVIQKKRKAKGKVFSIRFDTQLQTKFAESCKKTGKSQSAVMRKLMENFISGVEA